MKIVDINSSKSSDEPVRDITSQALLDALSDFGSYAMHENIKAFAVVALDGDGQVTNSWHSDGVQITSLLGAIELMRNDFINEYI